MIISFVIARITKSIYDIFMKTQFVGIMMNYIQKNRGEGFARRLLLYKDENSDKTER